MLKCFNNFFKLFYDNASHTAKLIFLAYQYRTVQYRITSLRLKDINFAKILLHEIYVQIKKNYAAIEKL